MKRPVVIGFLLLRKNLFFGLESLNMEGLSAGAYTMRVTLEGGKVFSDKVVKE